MVSQDVGPSEVSLPILKHRSKIDINDIVRLDRARRRIVGGNRQRVRAGSHDTLMPMLLDTKFLQGDGIDVFFDLALVPAGLKEATLFDFFEQLFSSLLGRDQRCPPVLFGCGVELCHAWCPICRWRSRKLASTP